MRIFSVRLKIKTLFLTAKMKYHIGEINHFVNMDDIQIFIKNEKDTEKDIYEKDLQTKCRNKIWHRKMCILITKIGARVTKGNTFSK